MCQDKEAVKIACQWYAIFYTNHMVYRNSEFMCIPCILMCRIGGPPGSHLVPLVQEGTLAVLWLERSPGRRKMFRPDHESLWRYPHLCRRYDQSGPACLGWRSTRGTHAERGFQGTFAGGTFLALKTRHSLKKQNCKNYSAQLKSFVRRKITFTYLCQPPPDRNKYNMCIETRIPVAECLPAKFNDIWFYGWIFRFAYSSV